MKKFTVLILLQVTYHLSAQISGESSRLPLSHYVSGELFDIRWDYNKFKSFASADANLGYHSNSISTAFFGSYYLREFIDDGKSGIIKVQLSGRITNIGVVKPRYAVKIKNIESWEKKYLPARDFGFLILSTPRGIISHREAIDNHTGGRLLAYVY